MPQDKKNDQLDYYPESIEHIISSDDYLNKAFENVLKWEKSDKELAQGRSNFQLEKFALLDNHTLPAAFESTLKSRRQMAEGYMLKLIEMKEKVREFEYKWKNKDKNEPILWDQYNTSNGGKKLCWYDLDKLVLTNFLKSSELEIRDRLFQMEHLDKILEKLIEQNGGKFVDREQFLENESLYWERRFADQTMDEMMSKETGISIGNLHSMRRSIAPSIVDNRNELPEGYLPIYSILESREGKINFMKDLEKKVFSGIQEITGVDLGVDKIDGKSNNQKKLDQNYFNFDQSYSNTNQYFKEE